MKRTKKILVTLVITALAMNFLVGVGNVVQAFDWSSGHDWGEALFGGGDEGALSFTSYQGGLAELDAEGYDSALTASGDLKEFILKVVNFALGFLGLIAVLMIIYAGVTYVTSAGQDEKTGNAKKTITYATIGLLIVLGSFAFVNTVIKSALIGEGGRGNTGNFGQNYGKGFNAIAEEVKGIALDIYSGYVALADNTEAFNNITTDKDKISLRIYNMPSRSMVITFLSDTKMKLQSIKGKTGNLTELTAAINKKVREIETEIDKLNTLRGTGLTKVVSKNDEGTVTTAEENLTKKNEELIAAQDELKKAEAALGSATKENEEELKADKKELEDLVKARKEGVKAAQKELEDATKEEREEVIAFAKSSSAGEEPDDALFEAKDCDPDGTGDFWGDLGDEFVEIWTGQETCQHSGYISSDAGASFLNEWYTYKQSLEFNEIIGLLGDSYKDKLSKNLDRLYAIHQSIKNISAIKGGGATAEYDLMMGAGTGVSGQYKGSYGGLYDAVTKWNPANITKVADNFLVPAMESHSKYYTALLNLQFVNAVLSSDVISGSEGVTVIFDVGNSTDPAGGSIKKDNIIWDPAGQMVVNGVLSLPVKLDAAGALVFPPPGGTEGEAMTCTKDAAGISNTGLRCTFNTAGTYLATVIVDSNEPTKYGPGVSFLKITVNPPTTKIELKAIPEGGSEITIKSYAEGNIINRSKIDVVDTDIENLKFDATGTAAYMYKWTFGNGEMTEWAANNEVVDSNQFGEYKIGSYQVTLEVMNDAGVIDKKIFTMVVKKIAASIIEIKGAGLGENVVMAKTPGTFDGSSSRVSVGNKITNYKWAISRLVNEETEKKEEPIELKNNEGASISTYTHSFDKAGLYRVTLTITGAGPSDVSSTPLDIKVVSKPPLASFDYDIPESTQPSTVFLENTSFDPEEDELKHTWTIDPEQKDTSGVKNWEWIVAPEAEQNPVIKFNEKGTYKIKLKSEVPEIADEISEIEKEIEITNTLDIAWDDAKNQKTTGKITDEAFVFYPKSTNAVAYEIDFGDGETDSGETFEGGIKHKYRQAGKYIVEVTVFGEDDNSNVIKKKVLISGGANPTAYANLFVNNAEITDNTKVVEVTRADKLLFSAAQSINTDGTGRKLKYSWDFGDTEKSSTKEVEHSYAELSPKGDAGLYEVKLSVFDENDSTKTSNDSIQVNVCPAPPKYTSIEATPQTAGEAPQTPLIVNVKAYGVKDADNGKVVKYRWWYFDLKKPSTEYGTVVTTAPTAQLTIASYGKAGEQVEYGIGLEITDDDGLLYCNTESCREAMIASYKQYPTCQKLKDLGEKSLQKNYTTVTVTNEANELPEAKFEVSKTSVFTGDELTFTSSSTDVDGKVVKYQWDFEGDGFFNNAPTDKQSVTHKYTAKNMDGYNVKLKVFDDKGGESISDAKKIYVDAKGSDPVAAFKYEVVPGTGGKTIKFSNQSKGDEVAGTKITKYSWDFDLNTDSDGDGDKTNDTDDNVPNPQHIFSEDATYKVKLSIADDQNNKDEVTQEIKIPLANPPVASLKCTISNATATCEDTSVADASSNAEIKSRIWDFDTTSVLPKSDLDNDGDKANDEDSDDKKATYIYEASGTYKIKLTVADDQGNKKEIYKDLIVDIAGGTTTVEADSSKGTGSEPPTANSSTTDPSTDLSGTKPVGLGVGINRDQPDESGTAVDPVNTQPVTKITMVPSLEIRILEKDGETVTDPVPAKDGAIYLTDPAQVVIFDFSKSTGVSYYSIDTNVNYDRNNDGIRDNDRDYFTPLTGTYQTKLDPKWGKTYVIKFTARDSNGNEEVITQTIKYQ